MKRLLSLAYLGFFSLSVNFLSGTAVYAETQSERVPVIAGDDDHAPVWETREQRDARMKWWRDAKFGMFIHFGLYSGLGGEWRGVPAGTEST